MADPIVVMGLRRKRDQISGIIAGYERKIKEARADLAHVTAALRLFEVTGEASELPPYIDLNRLLKRGETTAICMKALAVEGPLDTRELTQRVMRAKGLDPADKVMAQSIARLGGRNPYRKSEIGNARRTSNRVDEGYCCAQPIADRPSAGIFAVWSVIADRRRESLAMTDTTAEILRLVPGEVLVDMCPRRLPRQPPAVASKTDNIETLYRSTQFGCPKKIYEMQIITQKYQ